LPIIPATNQNFSIPERYREAKTSITFDNDFSEVLRDEHGDFICYTLQYPFYVISIKV